MEPPESSSAFITWEVRVERCVGGEGGVSNANHCRDGENSETFRVVKKPLLHIFSDVKLRSLSCARTVLPVAAYADIGFDTDVLKCIKFFYSLSSISFIHFFLKQFLLVHLSWNSHTL